MLTHEQHTHKIPTMTRLTDQEIEDLALKIIFESLGQPTDRVYEVLSARYPDACLVGSYMITVAGRVMSKIEQLRRAAEEP